MSSTIDTIRENATRANDLIKQLNDPTGDTTADETGGEQAPPAASSAPAPDPVVAPAPAAATSAADDENSETYAQRWRSLQGINNAVQSQLRQSEDARKNLEQLVAQMSSAPRAPAQPRASHLTEKDQTEYGADMVDFVRRVAREEMTQLAQAVRGIASQVGGLNRLAPVVETVAAAQVSRTREDFYADLSRTVPGWKAVNSDPKFHAWLLETDDYSGLQRDTLLKDAHDNLDLGRVVSIFKGFARVAGGTPTALAAAVVDQPAPTMSARDRLERQVAPGRVAGTNPPQAAQKRQWTRPEIAAFYDAKRNGQFKGREQEAAATERDIFAAQREGRVVLSAA